MINQLIDEHSEVLRERYRDITKKIYQALPLLVDGWWTPTETAVVYPPDIFQHVSSNIISQHVTIHALRDEPFWPPPYYHLFMRTQGERRYSLDGFDGSIGILNNRCRLNFVFELEGLRYHVVIELNLGVMPLDVMLCNLATIIATRIDLIQKEMYYDFLNA